MARGGDRRRRGAAGGRLRCDAARFSRRDDLRREVSCTSRGGRCVRQHDMVIGVAKASSTSRGGHDVMLWRQGDCGAMPRGGGGGVMPPQEGDGAMLLGAAAAGCRWALATAV
ncbi:hypothetical protein VPH35_007110 [Triticum aestivum]